MKDFRSISYPIVIIAVPSNSPEGGEIEVWRGWTPKGLGFVHIPLKNCPVASKYTLRMVGKSTKGDAFGEIKELDASNDEKDSKGGTQLKIIEIEFLKNL